MAITQTADHLGGWSNVQTADAAGFFYTTFGGVKVYVGSGTPEHTATQGSLCHDSATGKIYRNTNGSTSWEDLT